MVPLAAPGAGKLLSENDAADRAFHEPVLVDEVLDLLLREGAGWYLDGTVGGGGHARALLERCAECRLLAVDRDPDAVDRAARLLEPFGERVRLARGRFDEALERADVGEGGLSGALLDLGVSSHQLDRDERGFTFRRGVPLEMRMGKGEEGRPSAAELLNEASGDRLARIFRDWGEEPRARALAREIVRRREDRPLRTSDDLVAALSATLDRSPSPRQKARIFQAVRIAVNEELEALSDALPGIREALVPGGVVAVIAYHSLEDRIVKHTFREWSRECVCPPEIPVCRCRGRALGRVLTRGPIRPSEDEVTRNPRARSARLRAWRKAT